jgi:membrane-associated protease RseP (regulator of RpoE activity)
MTSRHASRRVGRPTAPLTPFLSLVLVACTGCTSVPTVPVPPPLPEYLTELRSEGTATDPGAFLGVRGSENDSGSLDDFFSDPGVRVDAVIENSPAAHADIRPGDVLLRYDAYVIEDPRTLDALLRDATPGSEVRLEFRRGDAVLTSTARLTAARGTTPAPEPLYLLENRRIRAGFMTAPGGVRVVSLADNSPFVRAGIETGTLLTALDEEPLISDRQLVRRMRDHAAGDRVRFQVLEPDGQERTVRLTLFTVPTRVTKAGIPILFDYTATLDGREQTFSFLDIWIFQLLHYERTGTEKNWVLFELFGFDLISFGAGQGELE